jgi:DNA-binding response OmpR family regulator
LARPTFAPVLDPYLDFPENVTVFRPMSSRTLLCVEPDDEAVEEIRSALEPFGFQVSNIPNGEAAIEWARQHGPQLIIVSVEPRKVGYAVCNKLKRSQELQAIPLILTSAEETPQTFEQHKKLKSRADEYLLKPFSPDELVDKVGTLIHLQPPAGDRNGAGADDLDSLLGPEVSEELSVGDSDIMDDRARNGEAGAHRNPTHDPMFDQEADAAFAAIQQSGEATTAPIRTGTSGDNSDWTDEKTRTTYITEGEFVPPGGAHGGTDAGTDAGTGPRYPVFQADDDVPPTPDEVSVTAALALVPPDGRLAELTGRVQALEAERGTLLEQIEELKLRLQSQPLSKEKEFLSLRETINRKEKDVLDLRDALDAKDRQILDQKDKVRELDRSRRDLDERMLDLEKSLMNAQERMSALAHDKEKSLEREKGLKARLDNALTEIQKAHDEADGFKRRLSQSEERSRVELEKVRAELNTQLVELQEQHRGEVARLSDARVQAEADLNTEFEAETSRLKLAHAAELEGAQKRFSEEQKAHEDRFEGESARLRREHDKALASIKEELTQQLAAERQAHQEALEVKEQNHKVEIQALRRRLEDELAAAEERRMRELGEAESKRVAELDAAEQRRRAELQAREEDHHGKLAELDRRLFNEKTELSERHRQELDQAHARSARAEGELAARIEELAEAQRRLSGLETDRDSLRGDLRDREVKLAQLRDRSAELEAKATEYEDQILRAYQKLRADEKVVDRAKRALAVALQLLDERTGTAPGAASGAAPPAQAPVRAAGAPAAAAPGEEPSSPG